MNLFNWNHWNGWLISEFWKFFFELIFCNLTKTTTSELTDGLLSVYLFSIPKADNKFNFLCDLDVDSKNNKIAHRIMHYVKWLIFNSPIWWWNRTKHLLSWSPLHQHHVENIKLLWGMRHATWHTPATRGFLLISWQAIHFCMYKYISWIQCL